MNSIISNAKNFISVPVRILNQPAIKEGVKNVAGCATFVFGMLEIYDLCQIVRGRRKFSMEDRSDQPKWVQNVHKIIIIFAKISLILSAAASRIGNYLIAFFVGKVFSAEQLTRFGPNTNFANNWKHPRHIVSIAAVIFALPSLILLVSTGAIWTYKKIRKINDEERNHPSQTGYTDRVIQGIVAFNFFTSRPILHLGNQWTHKILI